MSAASRTVDLVFCKPTSVALHCNVILLRDCVLWKGCMLSLKNCCEVFSQVKCSLLALMVFLYWP